MERNPDLERVADIFIGDWKLEITNQWWVDDPLAVVTGTARGSWLGDSFVRLEAEFGGEPTWQFVFGRSDARDQFMVLYHDERGVQRVFELTVDEGTWLMSRADPDFHQRFAGRVEGERIVAKTEASDDQGESWRKDFDLIFERVA